LVPLIILALIVFWEQILIIQPTLVPPNALMLISFPFQTIAVGLSEELMFRGYLYGNMKKFDKKLARKKQTIKYIFISSLIFGLFHVPWYFEYSETMFITLPPENVWPMIGRILSTGAFGVIMCIIYEHTDSLLIPIILHGLYNTLGAYFGSIFMFIDFNVINSITPDQIMLFTLLALLPFFIGLFILLRLPKYLAEKMGNLTPDDKTLQSW
jgi:membrane protease YdiL (CAAX protease family)